MDAVILNSANKSDLNLVIQFAQRLGIKTRVLSKEDMEDHYFGLMIKEEKTGENVSREKIMKHLE
ncbi:MAG: hypothetical protein KKA07_09830 [Bacteroidetes bacterium]|nr:hypothetical protein [Bacteroidota bacterium]MBU1719360.1 hypothetical protein [Bacteroidota bacterium]